MAQPQLGAGGVALQPTQSHARGVVAAQQLQPLLQEGAAAEAAADGPPGAFVAAAPAALGRQLQPPGQPQGPPGGAAAAGPMPPFIEAAQGRGQGVGELVRVGQQQLGQPLIGEAVAADAAVAPGLLTHPRQGPGTILRLLGEAAELAAGITAAAHVLHHHGVAVACVPMGVGVGDRGGDGAPIGLAHQQHRPGPLAGRCPKAAHQANAVREFQPGVVAAGVRRRVHAGAHLSARRGSRAPPHRWTGFRRRCCSAPGGRPPGPPPARMCRRCPGR